ncbi:MAG: hypothetical protein MZV70_50875 [Desulfobacterales bacterium]|nr:hypothetical protein [Desulfobacterales bacterium]
MPRRSTSPAKVRFGLFGKTIIVMLLISILPFGIFWFLTFRETSDRIRSDSEALMAQTAKGLGRSDGRLDQRQSQRAAHGRQAARNRLR